MNVSVDWNKEIHKMAADQDYLYLPGVREAQYALLEAAAFIRERDALSSRLSLYRAALEALVQLVEQEIRNARQEGMSIDIPPELAQARSALADSPTEGKT